MKRETKLNTKYFRYQGLRILVKREAGAIPAWSRRCDGEMFHEGHWLIPGRYETLMIQSQKTCLKMISHYSTSDRGGRKSC